MPLLTVVIVLIVVGVLLWMVNRYLAQVIDAKILQILNIVVVVAVIIWLLRIFGVWEYLSKVST